MRLERIGRGLARLSESTRAILSLPVLPLPPMHHASSSELNTTEAALRALIYELAASTPAVVVSTESDVSVTAHDMRTDLASGFPYTFVYADHLATRLVEAMAPASPKKGLITDLDETLWSGILGDDGIDGVHWDLDHKVQFHSLYQQLLNVVADAGALLAVATKNDRALVEQALKRTDLVVNPKHLFPIESHWQPKPESVARILKAWNVGPDSVVFVDDNPLELEQVKTAFPDMECLQFRKDDAAFLVGLRDRFAKREIREEDRLRVESLRANESLRQVESDPATLDALLATAEAKVKFDCSKQPPDPRALELINKTNQFNLNGARYSEADWRAYLADAATRLLVVTYEDRFGKLGKIAVLAGRERGSTFEVDVWVMSCRAFSRRIEHQCLKWLFGQWDMVEFRFVRTDRNGPIQDFLASVAPDLRTLRREDFERRCPALFHEMECTNA